LRLHLGFVSARKDPISPTISGTDRGNGVARATVAVRSLYAVRSFVAIMTWPGAKSAWMSFGEAKVDWRRRPKVSAYSALT
jgi:hypothetical protein